MLRASICCIRVQLLVKLILGAAFFIFLLFCRLDPIIVIFVILSLVISARFSLVVVQLFFLAWLANLKALDIQLTIAYILLTLTETKLLLNNVLREAPVIWINKLVLRGVLSIVLGCVALSEREQKLSTIRDRHWVKYRSPMVEMDHRALPRQFRVNMVGISWSFVVHVGVRDWWSDYLATFKHISSFNAPDAALKLVAVVFLTNISLRHRNTKLSIPHASISTITQFDAWSRHLPAYFNELLKLSNGCLGCHVVRRCQHLVLICLLTFDATALLFWDFLDSGNVFRLLLEYQLVDFLLQCVFDLPLLIFVDHTSTIVVHSIILAI